VSTSTPVDREFAEEHMNIVLGRLAGPDARPRGDQVDAVHAVLQPASRVLVVQATGWGKSAVYWAATHALRHSGAGPTLVVSPLLALMRDQVSAAERAGLG
jgi:ATP-dependent DNA helicase RecQ